MFKHAPPATTGKIFMGNDIGASAHQCDFRTAGANTNIIAIDMNAHIGAVGGSLNAT